MNSKLLAIVMLSLVVGVGLGYSISLPQTMTLQSKVSELESKTSALTNSYNNLDTTYNQLRDSYYSLNTSYNYLNESYDELSQQYEDLLFHYNLINGPASNFTTLKDLQITFMISRTVYYYKDSVSGNVTITYVNGTPFEGSFIVIVSPAGGQEFTIMNGFREFTIEPPVFEYGPGTYIIKLGWIYTVDGFVVAKPDDVGLPEFQVEVK